MEGHQSLQNSNSESSLSGIKKLFKKDDNVIKVPALPKEKPAPKPPKEKRELTHAEKLESKLHTTENFLLLFRLVGGFILTWDITVKIAYYYNSRFASQMLKQIYFSFLFFRPILLALNTLYRTCLGFKVIYRNKKKMEREMEDESAMVRSRSNGKYGLP